MKIVTLDFETYYDADYSLSKMTTEEYINDPRFQIIGVGAKIDDGPTVWKTGSMEFLKQQLGKPEWWADVGLVCHNTRFDGAILAWKFGIKPKMYFDTLSMARPKHSANIGLSLRALAEFYGLGVKGDEVVNAKGKRLEDFTVDELAAYGGYCRNDVDLTWPLFGKLVAGYPKSELRLINRTLRMYIEPQLMLDPDLIEAEIANEIERKDQLLAKLGELDTSGLKSNDKFADILRSLGVDPPMKVSAKKSAKAGHDVFTYAFAKSDADFVALLNHPDPMVAAAVEARLGTKSTQKETRAARFRGIYRRCGGYLPVPLDYYGAHTGRYAASEKINLQNLPRVKAKDPKSGLLRKAIVAPSGKAIVVADLSQIEARLLVWMANQRDKVEAFAQKRDVYSEQATVIYGRKVDRKKNPDDFTPGFIGKAVVLGCLTDKTMVLSDSGWKQITSISVADRVWDGEEWVCHRGVIEKGEKEVVKAHGLAATSDHLLMTKEGWKEWGEVAESRSLFQSALSLVRLPSSSGGDAYPLPEGSGGIQSSGASAGKKAPWHEKISSRGALLDAENAGVSPQMPRERSIGDTLTSFLTTRIGSACSTVLRRSLAAVALAKSETLRSITRFVELASIRLGRMVSMADGSSFVISSPYPGGIDQNWKLIESTTTGTTNRGTLGSLRGAPTLKTGGASEVCKNRSMTYDIAFAGPRNRFTVATDAGPVIVHNCGYGLGAPKFCSMIYVGMLGEKGILFDDAYVAAIGVDVGEFLRGIQSRADRFDNYMSKKPAAVSDEAWVTHCAVGTKIITMFRRSNKRIVEFWDVCNNVIAAMCQRVSGIEFGGPTGELFRTVTDGDVPGILMPNGMVQRYEGLRREENGDYTFLRRKEGKVQRVKIYGGALAENLTQALARIVVTDAATRAEKHGYPMALQVHDEIVTVADLAVAEQAYDTLLACMRTAPAWGPDIPLDAEGGFGYRYGDIK